MVKPVIDEERFYDVEELFYSSTAPNSKIVSFNEVFVRISEYTPNELQGELHSLIRHPDMPRAVFKVFWDFVEDGKLIIAYVKNQSKSGRYYWVLASAVPIQNEQGRIIRYVSTRLRPTSELFAQVPALYAAVLAHENQHGMEAAIAFLLEQLRGLGFPDYEAFMRAALQHEIHSRQRLLAARTEPYIPALSVPVPVALQQPLRLSERLSDQYQHLLQELTELQHNAEALQEFTQIVRRIADDIQLLAYNSLVVAAKAREQGRTFFVIAEDMGRQSRRIRALSERANQGIAELNAHLTELLHHLMLISVQTEMTRNLFREHVAVQTSLKDVPLLLQVIRNSERECRRAFQLLDMQSQQLVQQVREIDQVLLQIDMLSMAGGITVAELGSVGHECQLRIQDIKTLSQRAIQEVGRMQTITLTLQQRATSTLREYRQALEDYDQLLRRVSDGR
jgi:aerotaxis receptor